LHLRPERLEFSEEVFMGVFDAAEFVNALQEIVTAGR